MKFLADVNIPQSVILFLSKAGYDVLDIKKKSLKLTDTEIVSIAKKENRTILTRDKDFIALTQYPQSKQETTASSIRKLVDS